MCQWFWFWPMRRSSLTLACAAQMHADSAATSTAQTTDRTMPPTLKLHARYRTPGQNSRPRGSKKERSERAGERGGRSAWLPADPDVGKKWERRDGCGEAAKRRRACRPEQGSDNFQHGGLKCASPLQAVHGVALARRRNGERPCYLYVVVVVLYVFLHLPGTLSSTSYSILTTVVYLVHYTHGTYPPFLYPRIQPTLLLSTTGTGGVELRRRLSWSSSVHVPSGVKRLRLILDENHARPSQSLPPKFPSSHRNTSNVVSVVAFVVSSMLHV
ncbi:hypothetical protein GQ44DRAFT_726340 [Phaeosphaeriaceae sp. PMI808]|nr:hypothetical protein GQ44DRAFT_726340 [Phaeosphaeriaceae sp. PMI808]